MAAFITLTTDFGLSDAYVAAMKGVILSVNPDARLIDISHAVRARDIAGAAFILDSAAAFFPDRTIHLIVVDPGVGTERKAVILRTPRADFVAPDNGVLSYVLRNYVTLEPGASRVRIGSTDNLEAVSISNPRFRHEPVSDTFHGRDIFAPAAAYLSLGTPLAEFGERLDSLVILDLPRPRHLDDGSLEGHVIHVDSFGNLVTDIGRDDLPPDTSGLTFEVGGHVIRGLKRIYAEGEGLLAVIGSDGRLEVSLRDGSAASFLGTGTGTAITVKINRK